MKYEEKKAGENTQMRDATKCAKHIFLKMPDLIKCGGMYCNDCGKIMVQCYNVVIGPYCIFCVAYFMKDYGDETDGVVVKKVFIDTYNCIQSYITFKQGTGIYEN